MIQTRFDSVWELATLPWFERRDDELVCTETLGPVVDAHTHLAQAYLRPMSVDLERACTMRHYLPLARPLELDCYINKNLTPTDLTEMKRDVSLRAATAGGLRATHTAPNLIREMNGLGIRHSVLLAIDWPALSANTKVYAQVADKHPELILFGSIHPWTPFLESRLREQRALGIRGLKLHPMAQIVAPDDPLALRLYRLAGRHELPVIFHCGPVGIEPIHGRILCQIQRYRRAIERCPDTVFLLGHSGALQMEGALALAQEHENVWLEISCQSVTNLRRILAEAPPDRIVFGSDWPWYHQAIPLAKVLMATEDRRDLRRAVLWENAARLLNLD